MANKGNFEKVEVEELICLPEFPLEINLEIDEHDHGSISPINFQNLLQKETGKWCLVQQWNSGPMCFLKHNILFIKDCDLHSNVLQILYTTDSYEDAFQKWLLLWKHCFKMAYENNTVNPQEQDWFLLQLSNEAGTVTYEIVEKNKFHMHYNLTMINHPIYGVIYQMYDGIRIRPQQQQQFVHILRFASSDFKLGPHLQALSLLGLNARIYLEPTFPTAVSSGAGNDESLQDELIEEHLEYQAKLEQTLKILNEREEIMKQECNMLIDIMDKVRQIRVNLTETYKKKLKELNLEDANV